ncbi:hypothetical protein [Bradyrhizobium erythrophlei]|jgi:hypothetical protein|uniref:hypothetical protein n=1 Tax=Bradyrhizobium erythrophlei TaxID=1437360 RepID=UPI0012ABE3D2|nr:hypothetical protein [Bradyrhizobium erythrophlei]
MAIADSEDSVGKVFAAAHRVKSRGLGERVRQRRPTILRRAQRVLGIGQLMIISAVERELFGLRPASDDRGLGVAQSGVGDRMSTEMEPLPLFPNIDKYPSAAWASLVNCRQLQGLSVARGASDREAKISLSAWRWARAQCLRA